MSLVECFLSFATMNRKDLLLLTIQVSALEVVLKNKLAATLCGSRPGVQSESLIYDVIKFIMTSLMTS